MSRTAATKTTQKAQQARESSHQFDIHIVSEATGSLAQHIASVLLSQFPKLRCETYHHPFCSNAEAAGAVRKAIGRSESPILLSALTKPTLKRSFAKWSEKHGVPHLDLVGSAVDFMSLHTGQRPIRDASRSHRCNEDYYNRIDAWEFTLQHDDSRRLETVHEADIVLLGVSRAGKTPLAAYLGSLGYRVANIAIAPEAKVPKQLKACRDRTIGLTLRPEKLAEIRRRRFELNAFKAAIARSGHEDTGYYSRRTAVRDAMFAEAQFRKLRIRTLDMTDQTVEESAAHVLNMLDLS